MTFVFDKDYDRIEQVAPFYPEYEVIFNELAAAGKYPYNSSFEGKIPGIAGPDEETAIYLLQQMRHIADMNAKVAEFEAAGGRPLERLDEITRFTEVIWYGFYVGGAGFNKRQDVRLVPDLNGRPYMAIPKGKRTHGEHISGKVMVR